MNSINITTKILVSRIEDCSDSIKKLIEHAKGATKDAYAPYSNFQVGAAVLLSDGNIVTGNNQENAAYPSGLCAERVALFAANSQYPQTAVEAIAVAAFHEGNYTDIPCSPCGSCRQTLLEVENRFEHPIKVIMYGRSKIYEVASAKELLPIFFGKEYLSE